MYERDVSYEKRPASVRVYLKRLIKETYINEKRPISVAKEWPIKETYHMKRDLHQ